MNIQRFKHVLRMPWGEGDGTDGGMGSIGQSTNPSGNDATAWGGKNSGFDPNTPGVDSQYKGNYDSNGVLTNTTPYIPGTEGFNGIASVPNQFDKLKQLSDMFNTQNPEFKQTLGQLPTVTEGVNQLAASAPNLNTPEDSSQFDKNGWAYKMGLRMPGTDAAKNFFNHETTAERDTRMGLVGQGIGAVGNAIMGAAMPAPIRMAMGAYGAYNNYQNDPNKDLGKAIATGVSGMPGYVGALGNMYNGNYGSAITGALGANGIRGPVASLAGVGGDYASGKNIGPSLGGLAGQFAGQSLGGPLGGMFGRSLGQQMSKNSSIRK
jgi:hypothetical protein